MLRAVIVDDEPHMREGLRILIDWEACGFTLVGEAGDAQSALTLVAQTRPDLAILDIRMPGMEGTKLAGILAKEYPDLLVMFISGYQDFSYAKAAIQVRAWRYLLKPLDPEEIERELKAAARHLLERAQAPQSAAQRRALIAAALSALAHGLDDTGAQARVAHLLDIGASTPVQCAVLPTDEVPACGDAIAFTFSGRTMGLVWAGTLPDAQAVAVIQASADAFRLTDAGVGMAGLLAGMRQAFYQPQEAAPDAGDDLVARMKAYIGREYTASPSIQAFSKEIGFHQGYLGQLIKQRTGKSFHQHVTRMRMEQACQLLRQTSRTVAEIAREVGISDVDYFAAQFKRHTGVTPSQYRRRR